MTRTLVLDVYGTLVDPAGITLAPRQDAGESTGVSTAWVRRSKEKLYDPSGMAPDLVPPRCSSWKAGSPAVC